MKPEFDSFYVEESVRETPLAKRVIARLAPAISPQFMTDARVAIRPDRSAPDPFASGKRRLVIMRKRSQFVMACPASSSEFACCGYLVMNLASNCPMDCSYCFLQEYVADNPAFQLYANYADAFAELDELQARSPERHFRIGTGEIADSLAFDSVTELSIDLICYFSRSERLTLELKTKTNEIDNLLRIDPRGRVLVSWTLSP